MSGLQISTGGHGRWLPLPLEGDVDERATAAARELTAQQSGDRVEQVAAVIAGTSRLVRRQAEQADREGIPTFLAWSLLPGPGILQPGPVALLRGFPLAADATDDDVVTTIVDPAAERFGDIDVDRLETASGTALTVRWRPVVRDDDGTRLVHEQRAVLWPDREHRALLALSLYVVDLVEGGAAAEPLAELAATVRWSLS
ncbi:hypothetical protein DQ237_10155 [Blastococcus sp. TF02-8]|uniref:hypothetical protein n=1 Tax=Blastococcus sp. TF02-8 TaxID=2250574 RepID=UPI000DE932ED|nr:hypothetical protein [Blastococcus sp. TF02-8]RBY96219.1 hypothetical protein DQ237_10155 [Blastococcus sp. TF02-8]